MMMLTRHGGPTSPDRQFCGGPLASHVDGFAAQLSRDRISRGHRVHTKCNFLAALSRWLERRQIPLAKLNETRLRDGSRKPGGSGTGCDEAIWLLVSNFLRICATRATLLRQHTEDRSDPHVPPCSRL